MPLNHTSSQRIRNVVRGIDSTLRNYEQSHALQMARDKLTEAVMWISEATVLEPIPDDGGTQPEPLQIVPPPSEGEVK